MGGFGSNECKKKKRKKANWKAQSSMLRDAIRASKGYNGGNSNIYDDRVECPHCKRRFAEQTAQRHIPKCGDIKAKPKTLRRKRRIWSVKNIYLNHSIFDCFLFVVLS